MTTPELHKKPRIRRHIRGLRNLGITLLAVWGVVYGANCATPSAQPGVDPIEARRVLDGIAHLVVVPTLEAFTGAAADLESTSQAYAGSGEETDRAAAQEAWRTVMNEWERAEILQLGPAGPSATPGGMDLRDEIYSWPVTNRCRIDQELVAESYTDATAFTDELVNVRGLDAMEYLLFVEGSENACSDLSPINAEGTWDALGETEIVARRAAYVATLATLVREEADTLLSQWSPTEGDFAGELASAGEASAMYGTTQEALDEVIRAMFYLDLSSKDFKLGTPAGLGACPTASCPELVESVEAAASKEHLVANLRAFQQLFLGGTDAASGFGFDDLLIAAGEDVLAARMTTNIDAAIEAIEAIDGTIQSAVESDTESVLAARTAVQLITNDLKGEFVTALSLRIPAEGAGDAD